MERIAFIGKDTFIYWSPIIISLAVAAAIALYIAVYLRRGGNLVALAVSIPLAIHLSLIFSRFVHWYCRSGAYESFHSAMTDYSNGGFALFGVFAGCFAASAILRFLRVSTSLPAMLDSMALAGTLGIALGRLSSLFNNTDRGMTVAEHLGLPFAYPLTNAVTGASEMRLATFMIQSFAAWLILALLLLYILLCHLRKKDLRHGEIFLLFTLAYSASQIVCDSTRYDALVLRSNGFVSMVQIVGLVALVAVIVIFSVRLVKRTGMRPWYFGIWGAMLAMFGLAGYMEYFIQNNGTKALLGYSIMSACLVVIVLLSLLIRGLAEKQKTTE